MQKKNCVLCISIGIIVCIIVISLLQTTRL